MSGYLTQLVARSLPAHPAVGGTSATAVRPRPVGRYEPGRPGSGSWGSADVEVGHAPDTEAQGWSEAEIPAPRILPSGRPTSHSEVAAAVEKIGDLAQVQRPRGAARTSYLSSKGGPRRHSSFARPSSHTVELRRQSFSAGTSLRVSGPLVIRMVTSRACRLRSACGGSPKQMQRPTAGPLTPKGQGAGSLRPATAETLERAKAPQIEGAATAGRHAGRNGRERAGRGQAPASPVVEVTIGRIEVRAAPVSARPQAAPARPAAPQLSLDDYLAGRG